MLTQLLTMRFRLSGQQIMFIGGVAIAIINVMLVAKPIITSHSNSILILSQGKLLSGLNKAWLNLNGIKELATKADIPSIPSVIDNLTSTLTTAALSANQGRILKGLIDAASSGSSSGSIDCLVNNASFSVYGKNSSSKSVSVSDYKMIFVYCPQYTYDGNTSGNNWDSYGYIRSDISGTFIYRSLYGTTLISNSYTATLPIIDSPRAILIFNSNMASAIELSTCVSVNNHNDSAGMLLTGRTVFTSTISTLTYGVTSTYSGGTTYMNNLYIYGIKF